MRNIVTNVTIFSIQYLSIFKLLIFTHHNHQLYCLADRFYVNVVAWKQKEELHHLMPHENLRIIIFFSIKRKKNKYK